MRSPIRGHIVAARVLSLLFTVALLAGFHSGARAVSTGIVISQVYGGGGNAGATLKNDYIELFNRGTTAVDVTGWTVQYASAAGSTWSSTALSGVIPAGGYYLVQESAGTGGTVDLPTPDATGSIAMSATSAKIALVNEAVPLTGTCPSGSSIVDMIGYGAAASCSEGAATPGLNNTTADLRNSSGCDETDDNAADFALGAPAPRNSASPAHSCEHTLDVSVSPLASGSVDAVPDLATYPHDSNVDLTATPAAGYHFVHWSGDASGTSNPITLTMDGDKTVVAHFDLNPAPGSIVISQFYGGGGNAGADYKNDFVELYNRGNTPVDLTGWSVQYAPTDGSAWTMTTLLGTIQPGRYYLIEESIGVGGTLDLPTPDMIHDIEMHAIGGKLALVNNSTPIDGTCPTLGGIVDMVGYGGASCAETLPVEALDNLTAALRINNGCDDGGDNSADFVHGAPAPRNSATPFNLCTFWAGAEDGAIVDFSLGRPSPNPARGALRIPFALPREADVELRVFDLQGRTVAELAGGRFAAGPHEVVWDGAVHGAAARAGMYFIRMQTAGRSLTRAVVVSR